MKLSALFLVALLLSGCSDRNLPASAREYSLEQVAQGPTGEISFDAERSRESYLIPPEIPPSLLTYIFARDSRDSRQGEILSISVRYQSARHWTLEILREALPDRVTTQEHHFEAAGETWREV